MLQHENMHWEIVNNPNVVGERIRVVKRSNNGDPGRGAQSRVIPGIIPFPALPKSVPLNLREQQRPPRSEP